MRTLPAHAGVVSDSDGLLKRLQAQGVEIRSTEPMNLEDIFVTTVRAGGAA